MQGLYELSEELIFIWKKGDSCHSRESGCGKTVTVKSIMGLLPEEAVIVERSTDQFHGHNLLAFDEDRMSAIRGMHISMIFQDPMTSLNPTMKIGDQIAESLIVHKGASGRLGKTRSA